MSKYLAVAIILWYMHGVADDAEENSGNMSECSGSEEDIIV